MKASKVLSSLTCLALLSTYSVSGFAKSGNGDSYSGPTLSGAAVALTLDKSILNTQLTKSISSCLTSGGDKSYLSKVLEPFYGKLEHYRTESIETYHKNSDGESIKLYSNNYFNKKISFVSQNEIVDFNNNDLIMGFTYSGESQRLTYRSGFKKLEYKLDSYLDIVINLSKNGVLKIKTNGSVNIENSPETKNELDKIVNKQSEIYFNFAVDRLLIIQDMPVFTAKVLEIDIFDSINGDFIKSDRLLKDLRMVYDRNEKMPYSQILNASYAFKTAPTQFMAPNAELADCISDELGRL